MIISDNASTDSTPEICREFLDKDNRIKYFRQEKNMGIVNNFNFLLLNAKCPYFVWAAVDDKWDKTFIEKNVKILDLNPNVVGSTGIVEFFGGEQKLSPNSTVKRLKNLVRSIDLKSKKYTHVHPISGTYEHKAQFYLRFNQASFIYGLFRTEKLRNRMVSVNMAGGDLILNLLKEGDLYVIDEVLLHRFVSGVHSGSGYINFYKKKIIPLRELIFPGSILFKWCLKNIGIKFILINLDWFVLLSGYRWFTIIRELKTKKYVN